MQLGELKILFVTCFFFCLNINYQQLELYTRYTKESGYLAILSMLCDPTKH